MSSDTLPTAAGAELGPQQGRWEPVKGYELPDLPAVLYAREIEAFKGLSVFPELCGSGKTLPAGPLPGSGRIPVGRQLCESESLLASKYIPPTLAKLPPVIVVLHGCFQTGQGYAMGAGWTKLADRLGAVLAVPQQTYKRDPLLGLRWFDPAHGGTEDAKTIMAIVRQVRDDLELGESVRPGRRYITGLSAGGAMAAIMLAKFPREFAGGAILAGLPFGCAQNIQDALACMENGKHLPPAEWGAAVRAASPGNEEWPRVSIWHGDMDETVRPTNAASLVDQWTNVHHLTQQPEWEEVLKGHQHRVYGKTKDGRGLVECYLIRGMDHGTPVDPGWAEDQGGAPEAIDWVHPAGIFSSYYIARFWGLI